jgi:hypothetical protein
MAIIPLESVILVAGLGGLIIAAVTLGSLNKLKKSITGSYDTSSFNMAQHMQVAQIVITVLVVLLAGYVLAQTMRGNKTQVGGLLSQYVK